MRQMVYAAVRRRAAWLFLGLLLIAAAAAAGGIADKPCGTQSLSVNDQEILLFDTSQDALSAPETPPALEQMNQIGLSYKGGAYARQGQVYIRLAHEADGVLHTSPNATLCNFSEHKSTADVLLRDILDLDRDEGYTLAQLEVISYGDQTASDHQYALVRLP